MSDISIVLDERMTWKEREELAQQVFELVNSKWSERYSNSVYGPWPGEFDEYRFKVRET
jgi:hypothetical protein